MNSFLAAIRKLHYSKHLERSGRISGTILIFIGIYILIGGLRDIISHLHMKKTKYTIVFGKVTNWDKKVSHVKLSKKTDYFPTLEFVYEGRDYSVKCKKGFGEDTMNAFTNASCDGRFEIRVPASNPNAAVPNYEMDRNLKLYAGIKASILGIGFIVLGTVFILNRPRV